MWTLLNLSYSKIKVNYGHKCRSRRPRRKRSLTPEGGISHLAKVLEHTVGCSFMSGSVSQVETQNKDITFSQAANL